MRMMGGGSVEPNIIKSNKQCFKVCFLFHADPPEPVAFVLVALELWK